MNVQLFNDDCRIVLKQLESNSVDSWVTDPPCGIGLMGKSWDSFDDDGSARRSFVRFIREVATDVLRVLKPGAHGFVWALPRTSHWTAMGLELAGFEVR